MFPLLTSQNRIALQKNLLAHFSSKGWTASINDNEKYDYELKKGELRYFVLCLDSNIQNYVSVPSLMDRLESNARGVILNRSGSFLVAFNTPLAGLDLDRALDRNFGIVTPSTFEIASSLDRYKNSLPDNIDNLSKVMLRGNGELCASIAERYRVDSNIKKALEWTDWATSALSSSVHAHRKHAELLLEKGDLVSAQEAAERGLKRHHQHWQLLHLLKKICLARGNIALANEISSQLEQGDTNNTNLKALFATTKDIGDRPKSENLSKEKSIGPSGILSKLLFKKKT